MVIYGAGGVIVEKNKVLLLLRQNHFRFNDQWTNPGGKIDAGESIEDTVKREIKEECGVEVELGRFLGQYCDRENEELIRIYKSYEAKIISGAPKNMEPHKAKEMKWFSLDNLPENLTPYTKEYLKNLKSEN